jgi:hypothetical protein
VVHNERTISAAAHIELDGIGAQIVCHAKCHDCIFRLPFGGSAVG